MNNHLAPIKRVTATGVGAMIMLTMVLGFAPRILKAASAKPDLMGNLTSHADAACTPTPSPTPGQE
jgi:hypothetical protein